MTSQISKLIKYEANNKEAIGFFAGVIMPYYRIIFAHFLEFEQNRRENGKKKHLVMSKWKYFSIFAPKKFKTEQYDIEQKKQRQIDKKRQLSILAFRIIGELEKSHKSKS